MEKLTGVVVLGLVLVGGVAAGDGTDGGVPRGTCPPWSGRPIRSAAATM